MKFVGGLVVFAGVMFFWAHFMVLLTSRCPTVAMTLGAVDYRLDSLGECEVLMPGTDWETAATVMNREWRSGSVSV